MGWCKVTHSKLDERCDQVNHYIAQILQLGLNDDYRITFFTTNKFHFSQIEDVA